MQRTEIYELIEVKRKEQDAKWERNERRKAMYKFAAPHILLLEEQMAKLRSAWYAASGSAESLDRLANIAAISVRALEEIDDQNTVEQ